MNKARALLVMALGVAVVALLAACIVPDNAYLMELNRNGKWRQAGRVGLDMLQHQGRFTHSQVCKTYFHVIYATTRLGRKDDAVRLVSEYEAFCATEPIAPEVQWLGREVTMLKDELGLLDKVQHTLVAAMVENDEGNYVRARELCTLVLAMGDANDVQKASAHLVAAVCSIRLEDAGRAEKHLAVFGRLKSALPPDHQAILDEPVARTELEELQAKAREE